MEYLLYFLLTALLSTLFAMGGTGAGIAVIPLLHMLGIPFNLSKAVGLFVDFTTTVTSSVMNFRRGALEIRFALPLALTLLLFAPIGAQLSRFVDESVVKVIFILFLLFSASMMMFFKKKAKLHLQKTWILTVIGMGVGLLAGLLGVGGGNMLLPILILLGYEPKKVAIAVSFVVPFSALTSYVSYASFVEIDWMLLGSCTLGAILGGVTGNYLMYFRLSQQQVKRVIALLLYILALKMGWSLYAHA